MRNFKDHPNRYALANELHARPFSPLRVPARVFFLAIKQPVDAALRKKEADWEHLLDLLDRFGVPHPQLGVTHHFADLGPFHLKWEQHTEFVSYTVFQAGLADRAFDSDGLDVFPQDWLDRAPGQRLTTAQFQVEALADRDQINARIAEWFVGESVAVSSILDGAAVMAGDFRIDLAGHMRFAVFVDATTGPARVGRIVQRLCEVETYKTLAMLGLARARETGGRLGAFDTRLEALTDAMTKKLAPAEDTLTALLEIASELESLTAKTHFRFSATRAYATLVQQRIIALREHRFEGRQSFEEFMARRFDPSIRTVEATESRLNAMAVRAARSGDLLRTRVDVERSAQNQQLLRSMDRRADIQLRLQETVEGLSVVAISYYAVNLATYLFYPVSGLWGISKTWLSAGLTPVVILLVFWMVRRVRKRLE